MLLTPQNEMSRQNNSHILYSIKNVLEKSLTACLVFLLNLLSPLSYRNEMGLGFRERERHFSVRQEKMRVTDVSSAFWISLRVDGKSLGCLDGICYVSLRSIMF